MVALQATTRSVETFCSGLRDPLGMRTGTTRSLLFSGVLVLESSVGKKRSYGKECSSDTLSLVVKVNIYSVDTGSKWISLSHHLRPKRGCRQTPAKIM